MQQKKRDLTGLSLAFALATASLCAPQTQAAPTSLTPASSGLQGEASEPQATLPVIVDNSPVVISPGFPSAPERAQRDAEVTRLEDSRDQTIRDYFMYKLEGAGYVANDNGCPSKFGIRICSPGSDIRHLSAAEARERYKRLWDAAGISELSLDMRAPAFNAILQFGSGSFGHGRGSVRQMIGAAHGDPREMYRLTQVRYDSVLNYMLRRGETWKYEFSKAAWNHRQNIMRELIFSGSDQTEPMVAALNGERLPHHRVLAQNTEITHPVAASFDDAARPPAVTKIVDTDESIVAEGGNASVDPSAISDIGSTPSNLPSIAELAALAVSAFAFAAAGVQRRGERKRNRKFDLFEYVNALPFGANLNNRLKSRSGREDTFNVAARVTDNSGASSSVLSQTELAALWKVFGSYSPTQEPEGWRVNCKNNLQILVQKNHLMIHGEGGVEDSLKYAALAWDNRCVLNGGSSEFVKRMKEAAQKLVDAGEIASGFSIETTDGVQNFYPRASKSHALSSLKQRRGHYNAPMPVPA